MGCTHVDNNGNAYNGFDLNCDEKMLGKLKRRRLDVKAFEINACNGTLQNILEDTKLYKGMIDEDYKIFLNYLRSNSNSRHFKAEDRVGHSDNNGGHESDDEYYVEPHFKMFMENLKKDGHSYVFKYAIDKSMSLSIKYEPEDFSDDEHEPPIPRKSRKIPYKVKMGDAKYLRNCCNKDKIETPRNLIHTVNEDMINCKKHKASIVAKERGNSIAYKDLKSAYINDLSIGMNTSCQQPNPRGNTSSSKQSQCKKAVEHVDEYLERHMRVIKESGHSMVKKERRNSMAKKHLMSEPVNHVSDGTDIPCQKPSPKDKISFSKESQPEKAGQIIDECYKIFLNHIKENGNSLAFLMNDGEQVKSQKGNISSSKQSQHKKAVECADECLVTYMRVIKESGHPMAKKERRNSMANKDLMSEPVNHVSDGIDIPCQKPSPKDKISCSKESQLEKADQTIDECYETLLNHIKGSSPKGNVSSSKESQFEKADQNIDECNETFLNHIKEKGDSLAFLINDGEQVSSPKGNISSSKESQIEKADQTVDECYEIFLNHIKENGDSLSFLMNNDEQVNYEGNGVEISDSESLMMYDAADLSEGKYNPFETSRLVDSSVADDKQKYLGSPETYNHSEFRKKLICKLQEPFDLKEYKELWDFVNERKSKDGRHRDLRGEAALKSYQKKN
ncbi:hypothetical protein NMG60_11017753 [Bertholletia excelsa]